MNSNRITSWPILISWSRNQPFDLAPSSHGTRLQFYVCLTSNPLFLGYPRLSSPYIYLDQHYPVHVARLALFLRPLWRRCRFQRSQPERKSRDDAILSRNVPPGRQVDEGSRESQVLHLSLLMKNCCTALDSWGGESEETKPTAVGLSKQVISSWTEDEIRRSGSRLMCMLSPTKS